MRVCRFWRRARWLRQSPGQLIVSVRRGRNRLAPLREPHQAANSGARFRRAVRLAGGVGVAQHTSAMTDPFWGSKALAAGALTPYGLRSRYVALHKDVYVPRDAQLTAELRAKALWLRSRGRGVLAGYSAAALHGAKWIGPDLPAAIIDTNSRRAATNPNLGGPHQSRRNLCGRRHARDYTGADRTRPHQSIPDRRRRSGG